MAGGRIEIEVEPDLSTFPRKLNTGLRQTGGAIGTVAKGVGTAIATGIAAGTTVAAVGLGKVIELGNEYQGNLNELQAVSGATAVQMAKVGQTAKDLGADMTLPATSAADAANAMVELAKGGLSVDEAMQAAKGTLQLAAAAQVDGATAAELQAAALNSFGLAADQAGRVADVLANTANASASSMIDVGNSLKYVAPVSAALKISIEDTAAAIGLLANQGIKGEQAGTSLRGILATLASPSDQARQAMDKLGLSVFDAQGKFVGLRTFTDQLAQAKLRLSDADFAAASSTAFGNEGFTAANALAAEGAVSFDQMAVAVSRAGGAADVAAAQTKGLGGAWEGFKSQLETAGIEVYEVIAPGLERGVRAASDFVAKFTPTVVSGIETATAAGALFGPELARGIAARGDAVLDAVREIVAPVTDGLVDTLNSAINVSTTVFGGFAKVVRQGSEAVAPLAEGVGDLLEGINQSSGPVGALVTGLELIYDATAGVIRIVSPAVAVVGDLVSMFGDLPGPMQTAVLALLALRAGPAILGSLRNALSSTKNEAGEAANQTGLLGRGLNAVTAPVRVAAAGIGGVVGTLRQFNDEAQVQRVLADQAGQSVGRLAGYTAAFHTSAIPAIASARAFAEQTSAIRAGAAAAGQPISVMSAAIGTLVERSATLSSMRDAFNTASDGATRFSRTAGVAAAAGVGLRSAASGLLSAMGGPLGLAIAGVGIGLSLLADKQQQAKAAADRHRAAVISLAEAMREAEGAGKDTADVFRDNVITSLTGDFAKAADYASEFGIGMRDLVDTITEGGPSLDALKQRLVAIVEEDPLSDQGQKAAALIAVITELGGRYSDAQVANERFAAAADGSLLGATTAGMQLADAMDVLTNKTASADDRARALKSAMDALSGGNITLEQSQARVNEQLDRLADNFTVNLDKAKGWGAALLNADGSINSTTENGRVLLDTLDDLGTSMADVAQKTYDAAIAQGDDMPTAMEKARVAAQGVRDGFVAQSEALGLLPDQVQALADRYGLVPEEVLTLIGSPGMDQTQAELLLLKQLVDQVPPEKPIVVKSLSDEAKQKLLDLGFTVRTLPNGSLEVVAQTQAAKDALADVTRPRTVTITAIYAGASKTKYGTMNPLGSYARGAVVETYAAGAVRKLTPLDGRIAHRVPANTWRVIGDRPRGLEYYLPDDDEPRTMAIGAEWARNRGLALVRAYAAGGIASPGSVAFGQQATPASVTVNMPVQVQDDRSATEFARVASSEVAWNARFT